MKKLMSLLGLLLAVSLLSMGCKQYKPDYITDSQGCKWTLQKYGSYHSCNEGKTLTVSTLPVMVTTPTPRKYNVGDHVVAVGNLFQIAEDRYVVATSARYVKVALYPPGAKINTEPCESYHQLLEEWVTWDHVLERVDDPPFDDLVGYQVKVDTKIKHVPYKENVP